MSDELESTVSETVESPAAESPTPETPAAAPEPKGIDAIPKEPIAAAPAKVAAPAAPAYTPNFKFKAVDKDHEIPEHFRGLLKDAKSEKEVKELFEKAYGLDAVKAKNTAFMQERDTVKGELNKVHSGLADLRQTFQRGDMDAFFQKLNVPQEKVFQWVLDKVNYNQLTPEQRAQVDAQKGAENRAYAMQTQMQALQEQTLAQVRNAKTTALDASLARPDVSSVAEAFDTRLGKPGAFREAIVRHGEATWLRSQGQTDLTPEQAIKEVMSIYGISAAEAATALGSETPAAAPQAPAPKVIPHIQGRSSASPIKSKPKSIEDLKKLYTEMSG